MSATAFDDILRFWWDRGVAGFRIDVCNMIIKDAELRDNPPATEDDPFIRQMFGQRPGYNGNRPEVHDVLRRWRPLADGYDPARVLLGETNVEALESWPPSTGTATTSCIWPSTSLSSSAPSRPRRCGRSWRGPSAAPRRAPGRCGRDRTTTCPAWPPAGPGATPRKVRLALLMLLTLRGTPVLYQGDEIGLTDTARDPKRTPRPGRPALLARLRRVATPCAPPCRGAGGPAAASPGRGVDAVAPQLADRRRWNVADQQAAPDSRCCTSSAMPSLSGGPNRRCIPGPTRSMATTPGAWAWSRDERFVVLAGLCDEPASLDGITGTVRLGTDRSRDGEAVDGILVRSLGWEAVVLDRGAPGTDGAV